MGQSCQRASCGHDESNHHPETGACAVTTKWGTKANDQVIDFTRPLEQCPCARLELESRITATAWSDDHEVTVEWDCTSYVESLSNESLTDLLRGHGSGGDATDYVADHYCSSNTRELFAYLNQALPEEHDGGLGYECRVNGDELKAWARRHRANEVILGLLK